MQRRRRAGRAEGLAAQAARSAFGAEGAATSVCRRPRASCSLGVQGCGKSLAAKAVAAQWGCRCCGCDVGRMFAGIVGSSEENMRRAITDGRSGRARRCCGWTRSRRRSPGTQSSGVSDGGTTARVFAHLPHLAAGEDGAGLRGRHGQRHHAAAAGAPAQGALRRDLLRRPARRGRAATRSSRSTSSKRKRDPARLRPQRPGAGRSGFSGAEIEQAIISALYDAFDAGRGHRNGATSSSASASPCRSRAR